MKCFILILAMTLLVTTLGGGALYAGGKDTTVEFEGERVGVVYDEERDRTYIEGARNGNWGGDRHDELVRNYVRDGGRVITGTGLGGGGACSDPRVQCDPL